MSIASFATSPLALAQEDPDEEQVYELSPFEVTTSESDIGYYAENTLAGSRLNSSLRDLAASISVVTSQQLEDTAATNINDVFLYEANTEGTGNYTSFSFDSRGATQDDAAGFQGGAPSLPRTAYTANRVRGVGSVDKMRDYYNGNARIPFDAYNTDTVEINRGPNSILFGLGSPAGIVNQTTSKARLGANTNNVQLRIGNEDAFRASFSVNRTIIEDQLAIYVAALYDEKGFERKPSHDVTRRQYAAITYKPWEKTTIRANIENYENDHRRPNNLTPRDFVTPWIDEGRPSYNPSTRMLTAGNGEVFGPLDGTSGDDGNRLMSLTANTMSFDGNSRPVLAIDQGEIQSFEMRQISSTPSEPGVPAAFTFNSPFRTTKSLGPISRRNIETGLPAGISFAQPAVTDRSIYDYENINAISGNFGKDKAKIYNIELEQEILPDLYAQVGWYREDFDSVTNYFISQQTGVTLYVDTNSHLLDGSVNPNFGRPFIEITQPDQFLHPEDNETKRATAAYNLDFTARDDWARWLGNHSIMGLYQEQDVERLQLRNRPLVTSNTQFNPAVANVWAGNTFQNAIERRFYVGGTDTVIDQDPGLFTNDPHSPELHWFNPSLEGTDPATGLSGQWVNTPVHIDQDLHFVSFASRQTIESQAAVIQSHFLEDRIVTTIGRRKDESAASQSPFLPIRPDGRTDPTNLLAYADPQEVSGYTDSRGIVVKPFDWLSLHYNESDNFQPAAFATDYFNQPLGLPNGDGEDYGFSLHLLENKLYAKVNWFNTSSNNARSAFIGQVASRTYTIDDGLLRAWAQLVTGSASTNSAEVNAILQLPDAHESAEPGTFFGIPVDNTTTVDAEGMEVTVIYNPVPNWNIKITGAQQDTVFSAIGPEWNAWIAERMPIWTGASAAGFPDFWSMTGQALEDADIEPVLGGIGLDQTVSDWFFTNIGAVVNTAQRNSGKSVQGQREWRWNAITNYKFVDGPFSNFGVGGAARWEDEGSIGFLGSAPDPDGIIRSLDVDRPVFDATNLAIDLWASYEFTWGGNDAINTKIQINVRDAFEDGELRPVAVNPDGIPTAFRIVDPRQWYVTASFDF